MVGIVGVSGIAALVNPNEGVGPYRHGSGRPYRNPTLRRYKASPLYSQIFFLENVNEFANIDFEYTVLYYMLPSLLVFTAFTFLFYFLHPYTTGKFDHKPLKTLKFNSSKAFVFETLRWPSQFEFKSYQMTNGMSLKESLITAYL